MNNTARLYNCARCHCQVIVCTHCDRGNIYCGSICAKKSRTLHHRLANHIYQNTFSGRQKHALRQSHYRLHQKNKIKKVTDRGSTKTPINDLLFTSKNIDKKTRPIKIHCHFCVKNVFPYLRNGYLRTTPRKRDIKLLRFNGTG